MKKTDLSTLQYSIFDPTGNITALVETIVDESEQPEAASRIMDLHPDVEQVGFVRFGSRDSEDGSRAMVQLRMAGGEFCGNAAMSAAALYVIRSGRAQTPGSEYSVAVKVSGAREPVRVALRAEEENAFRAGVDMPAPLGIEEKYFECSADGLTPGVGLPVVHMEGIDHIIVEEQSPCYDLRTLHGRAEKMIREICGSLGSECLGLMFLSEERGMVPLVYVPGADTVFWENSCASGTAAAGAFLAAKKEERVDVSLEEPAGTLRVVSEPDTGRTRIYGTTRLIR